MFLKFLTKVMADTSGTIRPESTILDTHSRTWIESSMT